LFRVAELAIIAIIFVDVLAVCCEIMLESVCPHQKPLSDWSSNLDATYSKYDKAYHLVHDWETALGWTSKAILFLFLMKEALLIFAVGVKSYFTKGPHLIDFFITAIAFALEMGFFLSKQYSDSTQAATLTHLITILLVWRVVRAPLPTPPRARISSRCHADPSAPRPARDDHGGAKSRCSSE
jgi:hypothetical protein